LLYKWKGWEMIKESRRKMSSSFHLCCLGFNEYIHAQRPSKSPSSTKLRYTLRFSEYKKN
jgi:hypothetical protein